MNIPEQYEEFVSQVMREFFDVDAVRGTTFVGRVTDRKIKVDASFELRIAGGANLLVILECKHYKDKVSVDDVEEFHSKIDDIGAHKGIMFTTKGYQSGAKKAALGRGIALALLTIDSQPGEIQYIVATAAEVPMREHQLPDLLQGNLVGVVSQSESGIRFGGFGQLMGMLVMEALIRKRRE